MTREEAIKRLEDTFEAWERWDCPEHSPMAQMNRALGMAISALREQDTKYSEAIPKWIGVEERLPTDENPVLVYYGFMHKEGRGTGLRYTGTLSYFRFDPQPHWQHESTGLIVTHWMPLPEPPEVGV